MRRVLAPGATLYGFRTCTFSRGAQRGSSLWGRVAWSCYRCDLTAPPADHDKTTAPRHACTSSCRKAGLRLRQVCASLCTAPSVSPVPHAATTTTTTMSPVCRQCVEHNIFPTKTSCILIFGPVLRASVRFVARVTELFRLCHVLIRMMEATQPSPSPNASFDAPPCVLSLDAHPLFFRYVIVCLFLPQTTMEESE